MTVLSLGAGVQSTAMALMAAHGEITPMPAAAIFADTQWEPAAVYAHLAWLEKQLPFPVYRVTRGNLRNAILARRNADGGRFASVPWFTRNPDTSLGMGRRQCTREYKIDIVAKKQRELLGYKPRQRIPKGAVEVWIGISTDEATRMKPSLFPWQTNRWPLIEKRMSRSDCIGWMKRHDYPEPPKSACVGCPYHSDAMWRDMKKNRPDEWADAVAIDKSLREGDSRGMKGVEFMHSKRVPLDQVDLSTAEDRGQINMFENECEGMCGV